MKNQNRKRHHSPPVRDTGGTSQTAVETKKDPLMENVKRVKKEGDGESLDEKSSDVLKSVPLEIGGRIIKPANG